MNKLIVFILGSIISTTVLAEHLGPIVFDKARTELVTVCKTLDDARAFMKLDKETIWDSEEVLLQKYMKAEYACDQGMLTYIPREEVDRYVGRLVLNPGTKNQRYNFKATWQVLRSTTMILFDTIDRGEVGAEVEIFTFTYLPETVKEIGIPI